jgi:hypothetical protein
MGVAARKQRGCSGCPAKGHGVSAVVELEEPKELADVVTLLGGVAHGDVGVDAVVVASPDAFAFDVAGFDQVGDDALCGALGDADHLGDVAEPDVGVALDAEQHLGVVREEPPGLVAVRG